MARYKTGDPLQRVAERFFGSSGETRFVSPLTIVELFSVFSRILESVTLSLGHTEIDDITRLEAVVQASLVDCRLSAVSLPLRAEWTLADRRLSVPSEYAEARKLAPSLRLKTLDILHVAYSSLLRKSGTPIAEFVTGDEELVSRSEPIQRLTGIRVVRPS